MADWTEDEYRNSALHHLFSARRSDEQPKTSQSTVPLLQSREMTERQYRAAAAALRLPRSPFCRAEQRVDDAHVQDRILERELERRFSEHGAGKRVALQRVLVADWEFLHPRPAAEQILAAVDHDLRRAIGRRVEGNRNLDPPRVADNRYAVVPRQLCGRAEGQVTTAGRPEFCSQTALRLANRPKLREFLWTRKPRRFGGGDSN